MRPLQDDSVVEGIPGTHEKKPTRALWTGFCGDRASGPVAKDVIFPRIPGGLIQTDAMRVRHAPQGL
ncbi:MAG TPA: hypothetical protein PLJ27_10730 [Polyangiaceae bacterium]|jgi:hypothetical protein|nr:hypothetical protein [Polyangiaceae bacterium]HNZ22254.1 hypothetical protein [Polyangiaceae bacterium]HOD22229.1 hypothetical protein [Polyangiaceae bacterium]HOE47079.1 hypothetical protein [Polyangiaceae bacterium]HOG99923.1 hypothetical protein [Polyangiaceae bacterium]